MAEATVPFVEAPEVEKHPDGAPILKGANGVTFWPSEAKALEISKGRTKGARRAFTVKGPDGKIRYATSAHGHYVMEYIVEHELKYIIDEIGKPGRASTPVTATGVLAAIDALPEAEREAVKKQLEALLGAGITAKKK